MIKRIIYISLFVFLTAGCSKSPGDCFTSTGTIVTESRETEAFRYLQMENNVDVFLSYSTAQSVEVRAGKNIISGIKTTVVDQTLTISNENTCNWVRSYDKPIEVHISTSVLDSIVYQSSGNLTSSNQFIGDSLKLDILEGAGSIDLWIDMHRSMFNLSYGTADLTVRGYSHISHIYSEAYGPADLSNMRSVYTYLTNYSTNNCYVWATLELQVAIENVGDVYYWGDPPTVSKWGNGSGQLFKQ